MRARVETSKLRHIIKRGSTLLPWGRNSNGFPEPLGAGLAGVLPGNVHTKTLHGYREVFRADVTAILVVDIEFFFF